MKQSRTQLQRQIHALQQQNQELRELYAKETAQLAEIIDIQREFLRHDGIEIFEQLPEGDYHNMTGQAIITMEFDSDAALQAFQYLLTQLDRPQLHSLIDNADDEIDTDGACQLLDNQLEAIYQRIRDTTQLGPTKRTDALPAPTTPTEESPTAP